VLGAVEVSTDLTVKKQMQRQIQHARTLAALGEMAATVAHEIRNPLGGIGGFAGLLLRDLEPGDKRRVLVDRIVHGVASLNKIVSNLLVYTRPLELQLCKVELIGWLEEILGAVEADVSAGARKVRIERRFGFPRLEALLDPEKMQQVILNLLVNASQAYGDGEGVVTVEAVLDENDFLLLGVEDRGPGIPEAIREQIFNPFFTTKQQGTGLGLAIVQRIVDLHGGRIEAKSREGGPTRFEIRLDPRGSVHG
jgi:signal transduction histidine kinase